MITGRAGVPPAVRAPSRRPRIATITPCATRNQTARPKSSSAISASRWRRSNRDRPFPTAKPKPSYDDDSASDARLVPLEVLHGPLVLLRRLARLERAEMAALAGLRILFARVEPVFARFQLADHGAVL